MEDKIKDLSKMLKVMESRNELLAEEIKRNEDTIKKIENEISIIMEDSNESTNKNTNVELKNA